MAPRCNAGMHSTMNIYPITRGADSEECMTPGESELRSLIGKVAGRDVTALRRNDNLLRVLGLDGLDLLRVVVAAEELFGVTVDDDRLIALGTYGDLLVAFGIEP